MQYTFLGYSALKVVREGRAYSVLGTVLVCFYTPGKTPTLNVSSGVLFVFWLAFVCFAEAVFECNLRAYLINIDFEPEINNDFDIYFHKKASFLTVLFLRQGLMTSASALDTLC